MWQAQKGEGNWKKLDASASNERISAVLYFRQASQKSWLVRINYMSIKGPIERSDWTQLIYVIKVLEIRVCQFTFNIVIKWGWKVCMTSFLSLPPPSRIISPLFPPLSAPAPQATLSTPLEAITEIKVQWTLPRGRHFCIGSDLNNSKYRYQVIQRLKHQQSYSIQLIKCQLTVHVSFIS